MSITVCEFTSAQNQLGLAIKKLKKDWEDAGKLDEPIYLDTSGVGKIAYEYLKDHGLPVVPVVIKHLG